jgi:hypothetical protein
MRALTRAAPGLSAAVLAAVMLAVLSAVAADRDARSVQPPRAPGEAAAEDWHGNVRRAHWQP